MSRPIELDLSTPPSIVEGTRGLFHWVCTTNPFYVLSALLVLVGLWNSFGAQIRPEQTWALMFGLAGYTLLLAVPSYVLVRLGGVWEDVRTVLLLIVLMFLATSVTFDETLARIPGQGVACYLVGLIFAVVVSETMLRGMRLRLPSAFRVPYYVILALFFLYPVMLVPLLDQPRSEALEWALFGFSPAAGLAFLTLLPAIRRGPDYVDDNGSPWPWPLYPWALFVFLGFGVAARSFLLCWSMQHVERRDPEPFIFGAYFLVPFLLAVAVLLLELGLVGRSRRTCRTALAMPAGLVVLSMFGRPSDPLFREFLALFTARLGGTPLYLTLVAAACFYTYAALRRVSLATEALSAALVALAVVGPATLDARHLDPPRVWPILVVAALQFGLGLRRRDALRCLAASGCLIAATMLGSGWIGAPSHRGPLAFHLSLIAVLTLGAWFDDAFGRSLRAAGAAMVLLACVAVTTGGLEGKQPLPPWVAACYAPAMAAAIAVYGAWVNHRGSLVVAGVSWAVWLAAFGWGLYVGLRQTVAGLDAIAIGLLLLALAYLISFAKAGLLPRRLTPVRRKVPYPPG